MILITYGTRPEYIKIKPLLSEFNKGNIRYKTLFTGQHKDLVDSSPDYVIEMKELSTNRLNSILASIMMIDQHIFNGITHILVHGDTTSAMALSIAAMNSGIKIIHLEAGLRSYDIENPYPEEYNRKIISTITDIHLCPTIENKNNLKRENITNGVYVVGNTGLDNIRDYKDKCEYTNTILITLHRRENHHLIHEWFNEINKIAEYNRDYIFILPIHPNPNVIKHKHLLTNVKVIEPLTHNDMIDLMVKSKLIITDSGGLQEEASFFNKKCLVCRKTTERPESLNQTTFIVDSPNVLNEMFTKHINDYEVNYECPFGDGRSSEKIIKILTEIE